MDHETSHDLSFLAHRRPYLQTGLAMILVVLDRKVVDEANRNRVIVKARNISLVFVRTRMWHNALIPLFDQSSDCAFPELSETRPSRYFLEREVYSSIGGADRVSAFGNHPRLHMHVSSITQLCKDEQCLSCHQTHVFETLSPPLQSHNGNLIGDARRAALAVIGWSLTCSQGIAPQALL